MKVHNDQPVHQVSTVNSVSNLGPGDEKNGVDFTFEQIKQKYDVTSISPREVDLLVKDLRDNNLANAEDWLMLATHGHQFRSHLSGESSGYNKINLQEVLSNQLAIAKKHGNPTESIEKQIAFIESFINNQSSSNHFSSTSSSSASERNEQWLSETMKNLLDHRMGIDRQKLEEIDEKIQSIENDDSIAKFDKAALIEALEKQKQTLIQLAAERAVEREKLGFTGTSIEGQSIQLLEALNLDSLHTSSNRVLTKQEQPFN